MHQITEDVSPGPEVVFNANLGTLISLMVGLINTKICIKKEKRVLEITTTAVVQSGVHCGVTPAAPAKTGNDVIQRMKRPTVNGHNHSMLQNVQLQRKCTIQMITEDVRPRLEKVTLVNHGTLTNLMQEGVSTKTITTKEKKVLETTTTAEVEDGVLSGATPMIQRRTGTDVILLQPTLLKRMMLLKNTMLRLPKLKPLLRRLPPRRKLLKKRRKKKLRKQQGKLKQKLKPNAKRPKKKRESVERLNWLLKPHRKLPKRKLDRELKKKD